MTLRWKCCPDDTMDVTCALIQKSGRILATQRGPGMRNALKWEFPGGKVEAGESPEACILREVEEELGLSIGLVKALPAFSTPQGIRLLPFVCKWLDGRLRLTEHQDYRWDLPERLRDLDWIPVDAEILEFYMGEKPKFEF